MPHVGEGILRGEVNGPTENRRGRGRINSAIELLDKRRKRRKIIVNITIYFTLYSCLCVRISEKPFNILQRIR